MLRGLCRKSAYESPSSRLGKRMSLALQNTVVVVRKNFARELDLLDHWINLSILSYILTLCWTEYNGTMIRLIKIA